MDRLDIIPKPLWISIGIFVIMTVIFSLYDFDTLYFPVTNVQYAYSAIFQGFAAILALVLTITLLSLQTANSVNFNTIQIIYKIVGKRDPKIIPLSISKIRQYVFRGDFRKSVAEQLPETVSEKRRPEIANSIQKELKTLFVFLDVQNRGIIIIKELFFPSLFICASLMIVTIVSLVFLTPDCKESPEGIFCTQYVDIPSRMLYIVIASTLESIIFLTYFFNKVLRVWWTSTRETPAQLADETLA